MKVLSAVTVRKLRAVAETGMMDTCVRLMFSTTRDADNQEMGEAWTPQETYPCSFQPAGTAEVGGNQVTTQDRLWLPLAASTVFTSRDRVRITARLGVALAAPIEASVDGDPLPGQTATRVLLTGVHT